MRQLDFLIALRLRVGGLIRQSGQLLGQEMHGSFAGNVSGVWRKDQFPGVVIEAMQAPAL